MTSLPIEPVPTPRPSTETRWSGLRSTGRSDRTYRRILTAIALGLPLMIVVMLSVPIFLTEFSPRWLRQPVAFVVELLAAIPSVVYGTWGIFVLIPFLRAHVVPLLKAVLGWTPFLQG